MCANNFIRAAQYYVLCILIKITLLNGAFLSVFIISVFCCLVPYFPVGFHGNDNKKYPGSV